MTAAAHIIPFAPHSRKDAGSLAGSTSHMMRAISFRRLVRCNSIIAPTKTVLKAEAAGDARVATINDSIRRLTSAKTFRKSKR